MNLSRRPAACAVGTHPLSVHVCPQVVGNDLSDDASCRVSRAQEQYSGGRLGPPRHGHGGSGGIAGQIVVHVEPGDALVEHHMGFDFESSRIVEAGEEQVRFPRPALRPVGKRGTAAAAMPPLRLRRRADQGRRIPAELHGLARKARVGGEKGTGVAPARLAMAVRRPQGAAADRKPDRAAQAPAGNRRAVGRARQWITGRGNSSSPAS